MIGRSKKPLVVDMCADLLERSTISESNIIMNGILNVTQFILLTKTAAARNEVVLSYHRVRGLYFLAVVFVATIYIEECDRIVHSGKLKPPSNS